jgi:hypothetical protein
MKKVLLLLAATMLLLSSMAWAVPTINIDDTLEAAPIVTTGGFPSIPFISNPIVATAPEFANVTGVLTANFLTAGLYGAVMLENPLDPDFAASSYKGISDFALLLVSPRVPIVNTQAINLTFLSDGAINVNLPIIGSFSGFAAAVDAYLLGVSTGTISELTRFIENGTMQNLFTFDGLVVNAQSDAVVPVPASVLLFGSGLLGLLPVWRLRRRA